MIAQFSNVYYNRELMLVGVSEEGKISVALLNKSVAECPGVPREVRPPRSLPGFWKMEHGGGSGGGRGVAAVARR